MQTLRKFKIKKLMHPKDDICRIWLLPADGKPVFQYIPGQFVMVHELDKGGESVFMRPYSLASAPHEAQGQIELGVKAQGKMSQRLCDAKVGDEFGVQGPYGQFILPEEVKRAVFFAGGIGMTPFRSIIINALNKKTDQELTLFYSGKDLADLIYHDEMGKLAKINKNFRYIPVLTRNCPKSWQGECGRLEDDMVKRYVKDFKSGKYLMCGPLPFMERIKQILCEQGADVKADLLAERF